MLLVSADGEPSIRMFDDNGQVAKTIRLDTETTAAGKTP
jgi:hypothetical protein